MNIEVIQLNKINPAKYNPRIITKDEFDGLKESLTTFGQQENLIVNKDMTLISGHQRLQAMNALGWTEATCNVVDLNNHEEKKLNVLMNSQAISGKWDDLKLAEILEELKLDDNYEALRLNELEPLDLSPTEVEEDEAPEVIQDPPKSKLGEIYQLGRHRVMCGDSTDFGAVSDLMNGDRADITFHSPPYNASKNSHLNGEVTGFDDKYQTHNDALEDADYLRLLISTTENSLEFSKYAFINLQLLTHNRLPIIDYQTHFREMIKDILVWNKSVAPPNITKGAFNTKWEYIFAISKDTKTRGFPTNWQGKYPNVIETENNSGNQYADEHRAGYPLALPIWIIQKMDFAKSVIDLFLGTGTTLIACEQTDRICYGMELDPKYTDVIRKRWAKYVHGEDALENDKWIELTPVV